MLNLWGSQHYELCNNILIQWSTCCDMHELVHHAWGEHSELSFNVCTSYTYTYTYIYIYICCRVKTWSKTSLFCVKTWSKFSLFFLFLFFKNLLLSAWRMRFLRKTSKKKRKKHFFFCVKSWSNFVAQHTWTKFWRNLGPSFDATFLLIFGYF